ASDPEGSPVTFSLVGGVLPDGLGLNLDGTFIGETLESGVFDLQIEVCDDADPVACAEFPYQLEVLAAPVVQAETVEPTTSATVESSSLPFTGFGTGSALALGVGLLFVGYVMIMGGSNTAPEEPEQ
ncbi:MAG: hypothetical protein OEM39_09155, partial [Acidimicrobiia bacterium]|nr:hypothetical protein [Acidimicrobiia bacterium]